MLDLASQVVRNTELHMKALEVFWKRATLAQQTFGDALQKVLAIDVSDSASELPLPWQLLTSFGQYVTDFCQRGVILQDTLRQRGNQYLAHHFAGSPPVLHFEYEMVLDARQFDRPVNYALVRITPPADATVFEDRRPYVMIDPRAGHGPGIGGFKDDSQVGVALREGHPVYFVIFFPMPEPGQTMVDVCDAEQRFIHRVCELHPKSPKPVLLGNCQGGWAAMMVAASSPEDTGAIVISGAPMSYWGGAWAAGAGNNPMRYAGGLLGGTWLSSLSADLGNGLFDGAYLVSNFESLDPANTYWDKYYHVFANADTEPPRFLEFERWWGGHYLMNREEIEWITQNLFVGNDLWAGGVKVDDHMLDLRRLRSPIIMFASLGDNITPPQQAFNWVADTYASTEEIKAQGQVIVGLLHQRAGHLALFVSGKVAKREHSQIVSVLKSIEALPPGLYAMQINESKRADGTTEYEVDFIEHRLEDVVSRLNRFGRVDEKPFEAVSTVSQFNQQAYELFLRPLVSATATSLSAALGRLFHPVRVQHWALSDLNPCLWWLRPAVDVVKSQRQPASATNPWRKLEAAASSCISASLDLHRDLRDAATELKFFDIYGTLFLKFATRKGDEQAPKAAVDTRSLPSVTAALDRMESGGYAAALARAAELLQRNGAPVPLARIERKYALMNEYAELLPALSAYDWKLTRGQQDVIVGLEPERALRTLPHLLSDPRDRERFLLVLERIINDRDFAEEPTHDQLEMVETIRRMLNGMDGAFQPSIAAARA
jgi:pimeloyl-ACP methyl ester carboxylesterase